MLSTIVEGEAAWSDFFYLLAVILFAVAFVIRAQARAVDGCLVAFGLAAVAAGLLVL